MSRFHHLKFGLEDDAYAPIQAENLPWQKLEIFPDCHIELGLQGSQYPKMLQKDSH